MDNKYDISDAASDERLMLAVKGGDKTAFYELHNRYKNRILNYIYGFVKNYQIAEDITQEVFIKVYKNINTYKSKGKLKSWLYRIARNAAINMFKKLKKSKSVSMQKEISPDDNVSLEDIIGSDANRPDMAAEKVELHKAVEKAISLLSPKYKEAVVLCIQEGFSYKEAAKIMKCSEDAVGMRIARVRKMMRELVRLTDYI